MKSGMVMFQFLITNFLILGSLIIYHQLIYLQNKDTGLDTAQTMVIDFGPNEEIGNAFEKIKTELRNLPGVMAVSFSSHVPGQMPNGVTTQIIDDDGQQRSGEINLILVDNDFTSDYGIELVVGRSFSQDRLRSDLTSALILNEAAVKAYGYSNPEDIVGTSFEQWSGNGEVVGVVKDFNYLSLHNDIGLLSLKIWPDQFQKISLKLSAMDLNQTIEQIKQQWQELYPNIPFTYHFLNDELKAQYDKDRQFARIILILTIVSISIGVIGLIAFATFWCQRKKKDTPASGKYWEQKDGGCFCSYIENSVCRS